MTVMALAALLRYLWLLKVACNETPTGTFLACSEFLLGWMFSTAIGTFSRFRSWLLEVRGHTFVSVFDAFRCGSVPALCGPEELAL